MVSAWKKIFRITLLITLILGHYNYESCQGAVCSFTVGCHIDTYYGGYPCDNVGSMQVGESCSCGNVHKVATFNGAAVLVGSTCTQFARIRCNEYNPLIYYMLNPPFPDYLDVDPEPYDTNQDNVLVKGSGGCNAEVIPARIGFSIDTSSDNESISVSVPAFGTCDGSSWDFCYKKSTVHYFCADYNPDIFKVTGFSSGCPFLPFTSSSADYDITISLVNSDCETLGLDQEPKVKIYRQRYKVVYLCTFGMAEGDEYVDFDRICGCDQEHDCDESEDCAGESGNGWPWIAVLEERELLAEVGIEFVDGSSCPDSPNNNLPNNNPLVVLPGGGSGSGGGGGRCGGGCDPMDPTKLCARINSVIRVHNTQLGCGMSKRDKILGNFASVNDFNEVEVNVEGFWFRAGARPDWSASTVTYDKDAQQNVTKVVILDVTEDLFSENKYLYKYESPTGSWADEATAREATRNKIRLEHIIYDPSTGSDVTRNSFAYHGTSGNVTKQTSYNSGGTANGYVIYEYGDVTDWDSPLKRVWSGTNTTDYAYPGDPDGGRWVDLEYNTNGMLTHFIPSCDSCGGERYYAYAESQVKSGDYLLSQVKDAAETVLVSYDYDSQDRLIELNMGTDVPVTEWLYTDYDPADPDNPLSQNALLRLDYVNSTQYNASLYLADNDESVKAEYHYHDLQSGENLSGPYSVLKYTYEKSGSNVTKVTSTLPQGNKIYTHYDATNGGITKRQRSTPYGTAVTEAQYTYTSNNQISQAIDRRGATTDYDYDGDDNLVLRTDPNPADGEADGDGQVTNYTYDNYNRLTMEWRKDSSGTNNTTTKYSYDYYGNLTQTIEDFDGLDLTTTYAYNEYNQLTQVTDPEDRIRKTFYSDSGVVIGRGVYEDTDDVISATRYSYNSNGKLEYLSVVDSDTTFTDSHLQLDLFEGGTNLTWIKTEYLYDAYGRRTAVIADSGGKNLTTSYVYDNQSRVRKTIGPDTRFTAIVRDGRGMVKEEITGIGSTPKATTKYNYDFNGNLLKKEDPEGVKVTYKYDQFDRIVGEYRGF